MLHQRRRPERARCRARDAERGSQAPGAGRRSDPRFPRQLRRAGPTHAKLCRRLYRHRGSTRADRALSRHRGLIFCRGRIDAQAKIRGHRIELDEVAGAIRALGWPAVCVFKHGDVLAALIECPAGKNLDADALRLALARSLETYAIPSRIAGVPALPRNENDKIDVAQAARLLEDMPP